MSKGNDGVCTKESSRSELPAWGYKCDKPHKNTPQPPTPPAPEPPRAGGGGDPSAAGGGGEGLTVGSVAAA